MKKNKHSSVTRLQKYHVNWSNDNSLTVYHTHKICIHKIHSSVFNTTLKKFSHNKIAAFSHKPQKTRL